MRLLISFAALFLSVVFLQLGSGSVAPLDAISGIELGFSTAQIGLLGSSHFFGFFIGCWWAPRMMGAIGHSRAFAVFCALGTIGILSHMILIDPNAWIAMRVMIGLCISGCYTVIESWLQAKVSNENRGRTMGIYRGIEITASFMAQLMISVLDPASYISYNILAIVCCAALLPLALTRVPQPKIPDAPKLRPALAFRCSPMAALAVISAGATNASFRMVGPIYGVEVGLTVDQIAFFLAAFVAGSALSQYPAGWLADRYDRRWVMVWLSVAAIISCAVTAGLASSGVVLIMLASGIFGFATSPIYSVATAHAHDFATDEERVELSAALMFLYAVGAIASPYVVSELIERLAPEAMFGFVSLIHLVLILFAILRMRVRRTETKTSYVYTPRTSFLIGRLLGKSRVKSDT